MVIIRTNSLFPALIWAGVLTIFSFTGCEGVTDNGEILPTDDAGSVACSEGQTLTIVEKADGTLMEMCVSIDETDSGAEIECPPGQVPIDYTPENSPHTTIRCVEDCAEGSEWLDIRKMYSNIPRPACVEICDGDEIRVDISPSDAEASEFVCQAPAQCPPPGAPTGEVLCERNPVGRLEYYVWEDGLCYATLIDVVTGEVENDYDMEQVAEYCIPR